MINRISRYFYTNLFNNQRVLVIFSFLITLVYLFPLYFFGEGSKVQIYDNLDIVIPILKVLTNSGMIFSPSEEIIPNIMGGLPRLVYGSELNGYVWLHYFFPPFTAFVINETLMHVVAFISMLILLYRYFVPREEEYRLFIIFTVSLMFALLPFYTGAGLSVPTLPLALYAFINIRNRVSVWQDWLILAIIPFYSSLILVYFFFLVCMTGWFLVETFKNRKINFYFFLALSVMSASFVVVEYRMIYDMFIGHLFVSHRTEFMALQQNTLFQTYRLAHEIFLNGCVDMDTRASVVIIPFMLLAMILSMGKNRISWQLSLVVITLFLSIIPFQSTISVVTGNKFFMPIFSLVTLILFFKIKENRLFFGTIGLQIFFAYVYTSWFYQGTGELGQNISILKEFNFGRIIMLEPILWSVITALGMLIVAKRLRFTPILFIGVLSYQIVVSFSVREFSAPDSQLSYRAYYAEDLFSKIKSYIGTDPSTYRVGCIAFEPAIAIYNGLYTVDGYFPTYPLEYKHKFQKIIQKPMVEDAGNRKLFLEWGSKCYLFDGGESMLYFRPKATIKKLQLDMSAFKEIGGDYLISAHKIEPSQEKNLIFLQEFHDRSTFWSMYLYRVDLNKK